MKKTGRAWCVVLCLIVSAASLLVSPVSAQSSLSVAAVDVSSDATGALNVTQNFTWAHTPAGNPTLATASCGVHQTGVGVSVMYGGSPMLPAITNQLSNQYVGLFYLVDPGSGGQTVAVRLTAAGGPANVQCSVTTWTGVAAVDLTIANTSQDLSGFATHLAIGPSSALPSNEIFFATIHRYIPQGAPGLSVAPSGASIVESNVNMGTGPGYGCESVTFAAWEDCIGTAQLSSGASMSFSWITSGYALAAGVGLVAGTPPGQGGSTYVTVVGIPIWALVAVALMIGVGVAGVVAVAFMFRGGRPPPSA